MTRSVVRAVSQHAANPRLCFVTKGAEREKVGMFSVKRGPFVKISMYFSDLQSWEEGCPRLLSGHIKDITKKESSAHEMNL